MESFEGSLGEALLASARRCPDRTALWAGGETSTYRELFEEAGGMAMALRRAGHQPGDRVGILSHRTTTAYAAVIATLLAGGVYVPLNPLFKPDRNSLIAEFSGCSLLIADEDCASRLADFVRLPAHVGVITRSGAQRDGAADLAYGSIDRTPLKQLQAARIDRESPAYILFTSGTTGVPKGVTITHANVSAYVAGITSVAPHDEADRVLQLSDLTFDISVHDMFVTWLHGAALYSLPERTGPLAARFIAKHELTSCFIVPSAASRAIEQRLVKPGGLPSVKVTFFCGEALPTPTAQGWQQATPNGRVINLYGPTEATVALTYFHFAPDGLNDYAVVPIGEAFEGQTVGFFDAEHRAVTDGQPAELHLAGSQVSRTGYWRSPELNQNRFVEIEGRRWYRTGDFGRRDPVHGLVYTGRADRQMKIRGQMVELQQIEGLVRRITGRNEVAVVPWPLLAEGSAQGCVAFVSGDPFDAEEVRSSCRKAVDEYLVPDRLIAVDKLPLNANGKVDYNQLAQHPALV